MMLESAGRKCAHGVVKGGGRESGAAARYEKIGKDAKARVRDLGCIQPVASRGSHKNTALKCAGKSAVHSRRTASFSNS